MDQTQIKGAGR